MTDERDTQRDLPPPADDAPPPAAPPGSASREAARRASGRFDTDLRLLAQAGAALHDAEALAQETANNPALRAQLEALARENPEGSGPFRQHIGPDLLPEAPPSERAESIVIDAEPSPREASPRAAPGHDDPTVIGYRPRGRGAERLQGLLLGGLVAAALATVVVVWLSGRSPAERPESSPSAPSRSATPTGSGLSEAPPAASPRTDPQAPVSSASLAPSAPSPTTAPAASAAPRAAAPRPSQPRASAPPSPPPRPPAPPSPAPPPASAGPRVWFP